MIKNRTCPFSLLLNTVLEVLASTKEEKRYVSHKDHKGRNKTFISRWHDLCRKSDKSTSRAKSELSNITGYKINIQKSTMFLYTSIEQSKIEVKKNPDHA